MLRTACNGFLDGEATPQSPGIQVESSTSKIPVNTQVYVKKDVGEDVQTKIAYADQTFRAMGMTDEQVLWTLALIDHESAGTWSETVKGDAGCSTGIAQWNACVGRKAPSTYEGQVKLIGEEMLKKYQEFEIEIAVGKHNAPAWDTNYNYSNKVKNAKNNFTLIAQ